MTHLMPASRKRKPDRGPFRRSSSPKRPSAQRSCRARRQARLPARPCTATRRSRRALRYVTSGRKTLLPTRRVRKKTYVVETGWPVFSVTASAPTALTPSKLLSGRRCSASPRTSAVRQCGSPRSSRHSSLENSTSVTAVQAKANRTPSPRPHLMNNDSTKSPRG